MVSCIYYSWDKLLVAAVFWMVHSFFVILLALFSSRSFLSYFYIVLKRTGGAESGRIVVEKGGLNGKNK